MPMKWRGLLVFGPPENGKHDEHHTTLIDVIPRLYHHTIKPNASASFGSHQVLVVKSANRSKNSSTNYHPDPMVVPEVYSFFFTTPTQHHKRHDGQQDSHPLPT